MRSRTPARPAIATLGALAGLLWLGPATPARAATFTLTGDPTSPNGATWTLKDTVDAVVYDLTGILLEPAGAGPWPCVLVSHGAGGNAYGYSRTIGRTMRDWGLVAIGVNYTHAGQVPIGSPGTANDRGASEANLLRARRTLALLDTRPKADTTRIAAHGHSMGGFVTGALVGTTPNRFRVASHTAAGIDDSKLAYTKTAQAIGIECPYQVHHGDVDSTVDLSCDVRLDSLLASVGVSHELFVYPGYGHSIIPFDATMLARVHDWYQQHGLWAVAAAVSGPAPPPAPRIESMRFAGERVALTVGWPAAGEARVECFDVLGRRLATLFAGEVAAGEQTLDYPLTCARSGVLFVRARQDGAAAVRRFARLR
jgi:dienelactone hydrolase